MQRKKYLTGFSIILIFFVLMGCQSNANKSEEGMAATLHDVSIGASIEGLADHYHTGDAIKLVARADEPSDYRDWHWYTRTTDTEWKIDETQTSNVYTTSAKKNGLEIKAILFDDSNNAYLQSDKVEIEIDDHHGHDEASKAIYNGYFKDDAIKDRQLSDWEGDWQSVYPYLLNGDLDVVFEEKAKISEKTTEEYKDYYSVGYETDVERIVIDGEAFTFYTSSTEHTANYTYDGYEVLTYEKGNRGVRYIFRRTSENQEMPAFIQFSDHAITPQDSHHFHLYWGDSREDLLEEVTNWPTYYPSNLTADELANDMLAH